MYIYLFLYRRITELQNIYGKFDCNPGSDVPSEIHTKITRCSLLEEKEDTGLLAEIQGVA